MGVLGDPRWHLLQLARGLHRIDDLHALDPPHRRAAARRREPQVAVELGDHAIADVAPPGPHRDRLANVERRARREAVDHGRPRRHPDPGRGALEMHRAGPADRGPELDLRIDRRVQKARDRARREQLARVERQIDVVGLRADPARRPGPGPDPAVLGHADPRCAERDAERQRIAQPARHPERERVAAIRPADAGVAVLVRRHEVAARVAGPRQRSVGHRRRHHPGAEDPVTDAGDRGAERGELRARASHRQRRDRRAGPVVLPLHGVVDHRRADLGAHGVPARHRRGVDQQGAAAIVAHRRRPGAADRARRAADDRDAVGVPHRRDQRDERTEHTARHRGTVRHGSRECCTPCVPCFGMFRRLVARPGDEILRA